MMTFRSNATESQLQAALFLWASWHQGKWPDLGLMFAIPNGGARDTVTGAMLKREGVKQGVPDIFLPVARGPYHGLFIEMKAGKRGKVSEQQEYYLNRLAWNGYQAIVCRDTDSAIKAITNYMTLGLPEKAAKANGATDSARSR
jgi:hypothetical protein